MGIQKCGLNLNGAQKELKPHGTRAFPCAGYWEEYEAEALENREAIPWHWHEELEMIYITEGAMKVRIPGRTWELRQGDLLALNSNVLHDGTVDPVCELQSLVFHASLVGGAGDSVFSEKYLGPLLASRTFDGYLLQAGQREEETAHFVRAFAALADEVPGYEFLVREELSRLCFFLWQQAGGLLGEERGANLDQLRMQTMLEYIHAHFAEDIRLSQIAAAADIGERECLRCFQRTIQSPPMQYLLKYRMMQGADALVKHPAATVAEIAAVCGFDSPSNFSAMFKRFYNCTPRAYRAGHGALMPAPSVHSQ